MQRTALLAAGTYSRATMSQQAQQHSQSPQHRSTSVLASLMRMRGQFQRLRTNQQQQIITTVLARSSRSRLLGAKEAPPSVLASGAKTDAELADGDTESSAKSAGGSSSTVQAGMLLCTEAQRLLRSEARANDSLSDVAVSSPLYAAEAGKLLLIAATFGAATTYPRVQEICAWVRANVDALQTPRQIMSLCTPLINLVDGPTAGLSFVLEVLYEPLLLALQEVGREAVVDKGDKKDHPSSGDAASLSSASATAEEAGAASSATATTSTTEQQLVAITSAFGMVSKWAAVCASREADSSATAAAASVETTSLNSAGEDGDSKVTNSAVWLREERAKVQRIAEASVAALARLTRERRDDGGNAGAGSGRSHDMVYATLQQLAVGDVIAWLQALHGLEKSYASLQIAGEDTSEALRRLQLCYCVLLPLVQRVLDAFCGTAPTNTNSTATTVAGIERSNPGQSLSLPAGPAGATASATTASVGLRIQDVADLVQIGLFASVEPTHTALVLQRGLQALPAALGAAATVRETCLVTQVVNKVRQQRPAFLTAKLVRDILAALRPRLFLLRESQAYQLRPQECSLLLSQLSRWEDVPGVAVSADVVELLSQRLGEQMPMVEAAQMVPFLQALSRMEDRHRRTDQLEDSKDSIDGARAGAVTNGNRAEGEEETGDTVPSSTTAAVAVSFGRRRRRHRAKAVRYAFSSTARVVAQCAQRVALLAIEGNANRSGDGASSPQPSAPSTGTTMATTTSAPTTDTTNAKTASSSLDTPPRLSAVNAALLISALVQLRSLQVEYVFTKVAPLLAQVVAKEAAAASLVSRNAASQSELQGRVAVHDAVVRFLQFMSDVRPGGAVGSAAEQQAKALLGKMERGLISLVRKAQLPKDLVMLAPLVRHQLIEKQHTKAVVSVEEDVEAGLHVPEKRRGTSPATQRRRQADVRLATCFATQVGRHAAVCNGHELSVLALSVGNLTSTGVLPFATSRQSVLSLWTRCRDGLQASAKGDGIPTTTTSGEITARESEMVSSAVVEASPLTLTMDEAKRLVDALRFALPALQPSDRELVPPVVFLRTFAALCTEQQRTDTTAKDAATADGAGDLARGTARSYNKTLADLRRYSVLGQSIVSCFTSCATLSLSPARVSNEERPTTQIHPQEWELKQQEAWCSVAEAYLHLVRALMESYATEAALSESWWSAAGSVETINGGSDNNFNEAQQQQQQQHMLPPPVPLELLSMTARVTTQLQRLAHRGDTASGRRASSGGGSADAVAEDASALYEMGAEEPNVVDVAPLVEDAAVTYEDNDGQTSANAAESLTAIDETVSEVLGMIGDTIALLSRQQQQQQRQQHTGGDDMQEVDETSVPTLGTSTSTLQPKHLVMLLQAFETAHYRHPEMLYGLLPELRSCADQLDPLELSLLIRALTQLGAWNSRLLQVLATAVQAKMQDCELRQCHTLLRGLCRSGCVSPDTFVEVRGSAYVDWTRAGTRRGDAPQEPLQRLAESVLWRLDALVRTKAAFFDLARTASVADLVSVVSALRFFHVPPPPTYDAFVVLAVYQLARTATATTRAAAAGVRGQSPLPTKTVLQHAIALLDALPQLRQPSQQRVSASTTWAVVAQRVLRHAATPKSTAGAHGNTSAETLSLQASWQLWRLASQHSLQYGSDVTRVLFDVPTQHGLIGNDSLFSHLQRQLERLVNCYAWGPDSSAGSPSHYQVGSSTLASSTGPLPVLSVGEEAALRRYALHATPSLVRNDRALAEHLCYPLRLARRVAEHHDSGSLSALVKTPLLAAPAAQAKQYVRLIACLLRADLWKNTSTEAETQLLLLTALQQLWVHAELSALLRASPEVFTTEELVVLAAASAHLQYAGDAADACGGDDDGGAAALRQLCDAKATTWQLATAVDAWTLFTHFAAPSAEAAHEQLPFEHMRRTPEVYEVLARSGDVVVAAFLQSRTATTSATRSRILPELLRLFQIGDGASISAFVNASAQGLSKQPLREGAFADGATVAKTAEMTNEAQFKQHFAELQECVLACLAPRTQSPT